MGNRGNVIFTNGDRISPCIYLHWNGGPESIYAFLAELDRRGVGADANYEAARFTQAVGEFFDSDSQGTLSLGIVNGPYAISPEALAKVPTDQGDNGFYVVDRAVTPAIDPMRRFKWFYDYDGNGVLQELTTDEVNAERAEALSGEGGEQYQKAIAETFVEIANGRKVRV